MEKRSEEYTREKLITHLERVFGKAIKKDNRYSFKNFSNKKIADEITMAPSQFNTYLNPIIDPEKGDKQKSYEGIIKRVLLYEKAMKADQYKNERDQFKKKYKRSNLFVWFIIPLFVATLAYLIFSHLKNPIPKNVDPVAKKGIYLDPSPDFRTVINYQGKASANKIKWGAIKINEQVKKSEGKIDTINIINQMRTAAFEAVISERQAFRVLNFKLPSGIGIMDSLEKVYPSIIDVLFRCEGEDYLAQSFDELPYCKTLDETKCKTPFDKGIMEAIPHILDKNISPVALAGTIENMVKGIQSKQYRDINPISPQSQK
jgi:hypothetical protein